MRRPINLGVLPDGRIATRDEGNARFVLFTPEGESSGEWRMPGGYSTDAPRGGTSAHTYVMRGDGV